MNFEIWIGLSVCQSVDVSMYHALYVQCWSWSNNKSMSTCFSLHFVALLSLLLQLLQMSSRFFTASLTLINSIYLSIAVFICLEDLSVKVFSQSSLCIVHCRGNFLPRCPQPQSCFYNSVVHCIQLMCYHVWNVEKCSLNSEHFYCYYQNIRDEFQIFSLYVYHVEFQPFLLIIIIQTVICTFISVRHGKLPPIPGMMGGGGSRFRIWYKVAQCVHAPWTTFCRCAIFNLPTLPAFICSVIHYLRRAHAHYLQWIYLAQKLRNLLTYAGRWL